jgi:hypothetical protein
MRVWRDVNVAASEAMRPICFPSSAATARQRNNSVRQNEPCVIIRVSFSLYSFCCILAPVAPHPPAPFSHKGRRGRLGVLMPEAEDGTQGLPQKTCPCKVAVPGCARLRRACGRRRWHTQGMAAPGCARLRRACGRGRWHTQGMAVPGSARLRRACGRGRWRTQGMAVPGSARLRRAHRRLTPAHPSTDRQSML